MVINPIPLLTLVPRVLWKLKDYRGIAFLGFTRLVDITLVREIAGRNRLFSAVRSEFIGSGSSELSNNQQFSSVDFQEFILVRWWTGILRTYVVLRS